VLLSLSLLLLLLLLLALSSPSLPRLGSPAGRAAGAPAAAAAAHPSASWRWSIDCDKGTRVRAMFTLARLSPPVSLCSSSTAASLTTMRDGTGSLFSGCAWCGAPAAFK